MKAVIEINYAEIEEILLTHLRSHGVKVSGKLQFVCVGERNASPTLSHVKAEIEVGTTLQYIPEDRR